MQRRGWTTRWLHVRRRTVGLEPIPGGSRQALRIPAADLPTGYVLLRIRIAGGRGHIRLLTELPGGDLLPCYDFADLAAGDGSRLVFLPDGGRRLVLETSGDVIVGAVLLDELGTAPLLAALGWRWTRRQLRRPGRLPEKVTNAVRVLVTQGPGAIRARMLVAQVSAQDDPEEADLSGVVPAAHERSTWHAPRRRGRGLRAARARRSGELAAELDRFLHSDEHLSLPRPPAPETSVVIVTYGQAELTLACLRALAAHAGPDVEVVIVDNASPDRTAELLERVDGAVVIRNTDNRGFLLACNQGVERSTGRLVVLLNNDAVIEAGAMAAAASSLDEISGAGIVGGALLAVDGRLQEAGSIVWRDGSCEGYGRGDDADAFPYRFRREVDFVSGTFMMTTRRVWDELGGFDSAFAPASYEDVDFCLRARLKDYRVVYEPAARVVHIGHGSGTVTSTRTSMPRHRDLLRQRHSALLADRPLRSAGARTEARSPGRRRILVVDDRVPQPWSGGGAPRAVALLRALVDLGHEVTFFPTLPFAGSWEDVYRDVPRDIEVVVGRGSPNLGAFLQSRPTFFDDVVVSRPHNMERLERARRRHPELLGRARLVYDAEAVAALRSLAGLRYQTSSPAMGADTLEKEIALAAGAERVWCVSASERDLMAGRGVADVQLVAHSVAVRPTPRPFDDRSGFLFVGPVVQDGSPNVDSVAWFLDEVLPRIRARLGDVELVLAGRATSTRVNQSGRSGVRFLGVVDDLGPVYDKARVFVAPARFAAGLPLKVLDAAAHGLPVVATDLLGDQLGWESGHELLTAPVGDSAAFADACVAAHQDASLWASLRAAAMARVEADCSPSVFRAALARGLAWDEGVRSAAPVRFVVTCAARTGSTLLVWCLRSHPQVCMHGEAFAADGPLTLEGLDPALGRPLEAALRHQRDADPAAFLRTVLFEPGDRRAVGLKFKYEELSLRRWAKAGRALVDDVEVRVIHLRRENLLERYLSQHVATRLTHVYNVTSPEARPEVDAVTLSPLECLADFELTESREKHFGGLFARHPVLDVTYEQLVGDRAGALARIQQFLGVDVVPVEPRSVKLRQVPVSEAIANYEELARFFAGTAYARFFTT